MKVAKMTARIANSMIPRFRVWIKENSSLDDYMQSPLKPSILNAVKRFPSQPEPVGATTQTLTLSCRDHISLVNLVDSSITVRSQKGNPSKCHNNLRSYNRVFEYPDGAE